MMGFRPTAPAKKELPAWYRGPDAPVFEGSVKSLFTSDDGKTRGLRRGR